MCLTNHWPVATPVAGERGLIAIPRALRLCWLQLELHRGWDSEETVRSDSGGWSRSSALKHSLRRDIIRVIACREIREGDRQPWCARGPRRGPLRPVDIPNRLTRFWGRHCPVVPGLTAWEGGSGGQRSAAPVRVGRLWRHGGGGDYIPSRPVMNRDIERGRTALCREIGERQVRSGRQMASRCLAGVFQHLLSLGLGPQVFCLRCIPSRPDGVLI